MKNLMYSTGSDTIRLTDTNHCIAIRYNNRMVLDIDSGVNLELALSIFKVWHSLNTYCLGAQQIVDTINLILNDCKIHIGGTKIPLYWNNSINELGILRYCNLNYLHGENIKFYHDVSSNSLRIWLDELSEPMDVSLTWN